MKNTIIPILVVIAVIVTGFYVTQGGNTGAKTKLRTTAIIRGDLLSTVNATGTVQSEELVNIGAQVAGQIVRFGDDPNSPSKHVDYCSVVEQDSILAVIDPTSYEAALEQAEAILASSQANLEQLKAQFRKSESEWKRAQSLIATKAIAESDYDTAKADYEIAKAQVSVGEAQIRQNEASLKMARTNHGYCMIKSPVNGTIIERRVNIGQTVVASLNAPSLFLIAKDLTKMEIWASVNEADIARIRLGMPTWFTVDAHEDKIFHGTVTQIRMNAQMTQNVVTYTVVVTTDNSSGVLMTYMTANVHFEIERKNNVLLVPNSALRWSPDTTQIAASIDKSLIDTELPEGQRHIWIAGPDGLVTPLEVTVGSSDGSMTEISGPGVEEGVRIVIGEDDADSEEYAGDASSDSETSNPFMPKPPKGSRPPPGPM